MRGSLVSFTLALATWAASAAFGQTPQTAVGDLNLIAALSHVRWQGAVPSADIVKGKSSVVLVYATWCPKCNVWSPELFKQLRNAAGEQPVTVFAINADETSPGVGYAVERGLVGPNIVHGVDPGLPARLGFDSNLFKYAVFGVEGKLIERGEGGMFYDNPTGKDFVVADKLRKGTYPGEFALLSREMSPQIKQLLWPAELGQPITDKSLLKMRGALPAAEHNDFNMAIRSYLDKQLAQCESGIAGSVPQQITGHATATLLATRFPSTPQGKRAQAIVSKFDNDPQFKKEVSAASAYRSAVAEATPSATKRALIRVANRFEGTHYGKLSGEEAASL